MALTSTTGGRLTALVLCAATALAGCSGGSSASPQGASTGRTTGSKPTTSTKPATSSTPGGVYAADAVGNLTGAAKGARPMVYVPNTVSNSVELIDPKTYQVIGRFPTGREPQHVVPSWDLKTLWVNDDLGNDLIPIDPRTGKHGSKVRVEDPYNLYFTPDGKHALVMAERMRRIDVRDAKTMKLQRSLRVPCAGVNHADFTADLSSFVASCEFSGKLLVIDKDATKIRKVINLNSITTPGATSTMEMLHPGVPNPNLQPGANAMPQDVRLTPSGKYFVVADMLRNGVWVIDAKTLKYDRFLRTGKGAHGIYPDRGGKRLFVSNRDVGSVSVLDAATLKQVALWKIPGGGSPDMGGVTADGKELWLSGRYHGMVYVFDTSTGKVTHRIRVEAGPHGLCVWPQPGRFSLGHTGNMR